jgi:UDP-N-acetylglucosamine--N-acetylmuramyl-(pentapeptide) pyrophosphoryl-undecaprenol N-acetylglucosamine transferase
MTYAFAAAGTGGHLFPAIAVANELRGRGVDAGDVVFFGGDRLETIVVPEAGFELVQLDIHGLRRSISLENLALPFLVRRAARTVADELRRRSAKVVTAFGGYVTVPAGMGASRAGIPLVLHEQNAVPGLANRVTTRRAARTLVAFPSSLPRLHGAELTGNPLPNRIATFDRGALRKDARSGYGLDPERTVLGVVGGSQGAAAINERVAGFAARVLGEGHSILHLTGPAHYEEMSARASSHPGWVIVPYEDRMERFYAASDLVLSRAGAMTISELTATGTPAVVIPLPAGKGYQAENAGEMERAGGCVVVHQEAADGLATLVDGLLGDAERRNEMAAAAAGVGRRNAAGLVADAILEVADG